MIDPTALARHEPALFLHLMAALVALGLGPFAIYRRRRDRLHRGLGHGWVAAMALTALSSFGLPAALMPIALGFGAIHLLSVWVLVQLSLGVRDARAGRIPAHRARMVGLYWQALGVAGLLTLLPGRMLNAALFGARPEIGLWVVAALGAALLPVVFGRVLRAPRAPDGRPG
jgi:uncharacterized membrane protein